jgi:hypothetical protein
LKHYRGRARSSRKKANSAGIILRCAAFLLLVTGCVVAVRWLGGETTSTGEGERTSKLPSLSTLGSLRPTSVQERNRRVVYPYSVVPGGVRSSEELQTVATHDPVVAEHYSGFSYKQARVIEVSEPKLVYLSYRRGDHIYWTRKQASLRVGEKLLTDGHITARTRCGNQVSVLPQAATSPNEPTMAELDRPDAVASGAEQLFPNNLSTELRPLDPGMPLASMPGNAFSGGPPPGVFMPGPIGGGSGPVTIPTGGGCPPNKIDNSKDCQHNPPPPPPPVPEPGTIVLMASGAAALIARYRYKR